ncbi:MAG: histone deacetylase [Burkholderiales bacterium]
MKAFYSDHFVLPLPQGHRFPMQKYGRLRERIAHELTDVSLCEALPATDGQLALAHHPLWIEKVSQGGLSAQEQRLLGFPWSPAMAERSRRSVGATIGACEAARHDGFAANLAGGTHHAYADRGEGFCCFNDLAVAARWVQARSWARQVLCLDLDVHQGNGTARIFNNDPSVYTLSLHGAKNFPFTKEVSDSDWPLEDGTGDDAYLACLQEALSEVSRRFRADWVLYIAGADVFAGDRLGRLALSKIGIAMRDRMVFDWCSDQGLPCVVTMGGGYASPIDDTIEIHLETIRLATKAASQHRARIAAYQELSICPPSL